jgi:hypothetical protein
VHLVGFTEKYITMHGPINVKYFSKICIEAYKLNFIHCLLFSGIDLYLVGKIQIIFILLS